jgi:RimJ/RimL family protein N-acetyltransferase
MENFKEIIDTYLLNYSTYKKGKVIFECDYGELIFIKDKSEICIIHGIFIFPQYRNKGLCRDILHYLIDKCPNNFKYICIESVISNILYEYLLRFEYKNKKFKLIKSGFLYKI